MEEVEPRVALVFKHSINPDHLMIDIALILCIEPRFTNPIGENERSTADAFIKSKNWKCVYLPRAGGAKILASEDPADAPKKAAFLADIEQEIGLHHPERLGLSVHMDCGGYGYSKTFGNDLAKERAVLLGDLKKAGVLLGEKFGARVKEILFYVFTFDGVEEIYF
ncbi:MAG TPA: hypothetical protein VIJ29_00250 [Candidatus Paceibacterota bacterium]